MKSNRAPMIALTSHSTSEEIAAIGDLAKSEPDLITDVVVRVLVDIMISGNNSDVRGAAAGAIGSIAKTKPDLLNPNIINQLFDMRTDSNSYEPKAIAAIGSIATTRPAFISNLTIDKLLNLVNNENNYDVRAAAAGAIGSIAVKRSDLITEAAAAAAFANLSL